jgi:hypothetical protein
MYLTLRIIVLELTFHTLLQGSCHLRLNLPSDIFTSNFLTKVVNLGLATNLIFLDFAVILTFGETLNKS